jgi:hypothetical protein
MIEKTSSVERVLGTALARRLEAWLRLWGMPDLEQRITVRVSARMTRSLGRCAPARGAIWLSRLVVNGSPSVLETVLCHEAAHLAVFARHGRGRNPHGPEWAALVRMAGFEPSMRPADGEGTLRPRPGIASGRYEHRCPVCQMVRVARRPVTQWRCASCVATGLPGDLEITRIVMGRGRPG